MKDTSGGFTLLEVLVAVSVLAVAVVTVLQIFAGSLRSVSLSGDYVDAVVLAQSRMRQVLSVQELSEDTWTETAGDGHEISVSVRKSPEPAIESFELYDIELSVLWGSGTKRRSYTLDTVRLQKAPK